MNLHRASRKSFRSNPLSKSICSRRIYVMVIWEIYSQLGDRTVMYYLNWLVSSLLLLPVVVVMMDGRKIRRNLWQSYVRLMFENTEEFRFRADARILWRERERDQLFWKSRKSEWNSKENLPDGKRLSESDPYELRRDEFPSLGNCKSIFRDALVPL